MDNITKLIDIGLLPQNIDILIYSTGKAGGTTLYSTLNNNGFNCFYLHNSNSLINNIKYDIKYKSEYAQYVDNLTVENLIEYYSKNKKNFYIIDSYRNLLEMNISNFFQNIVYIFEMDSQIKYKLDDILKMDINILIEIFEKKIINKHICTNEKLEQTSDIIINNEKFDHEKKYIEYQSNNIKYIKIRFNDIKNWDNILSTIFDKKIEIFSSNLSEEKNYKYKYNEFLNEYKIDKQLFYDKFINYKYFKYFNSEEEQLEYIKKWESKFKE